MENSHNVLVFVYMFVMITIQFYVSIFYLSTEHCVGTENSDGNERMKRPAFFSVDSGSEPEGGLSDKVSKLVNVIELGSRDRFLKKSLWEC